MSGSEILPSGRTVTSADSSLSRQKTTDITSSVPMMYSAGTVATGATAGAAAFATLLALPAAVVLAADCAAEGAAIANVATAAPMVLAILFERNLAVMFSQEV